MDIKKDKRAVGVYHQRNGEIKGSWKTKQPAMKDISKYCQEEGSFFTRNYISDEYIIMTIHNHKEIIIAI